MKLILENWRKFLNEDIPPGMSREELMSNPGTMEASIRCFIPNQGATLEEVVEIMIGLGYMTLSTGLGDPEVACSNEFVEAITMAQMDLGFKGDDVDGVLGPMTIKALKNKLKKPQTKKKKFIKPIGVPKTFTPEMKENYLKPEIKEKITTQKSFAQNSEIELERLYKVSRKKKKKKIRKIGSRPAPYFAPEDPIISEKWNINIPLIMAFRSVEQDPRKGAETFLIMKNLFHTYTKFKFLDHPKIGYKIGHRNREQALKKLFKSGPKIDGSNKYIRFSKGDQRPYKKIPHRTGSIFSDMSRSVDILKTMFALDPVSAIRATSFGRFQVHPSRVVAKRLSKDEEFKKIFIDQTADTETAEKYSRVFLDGWLESRKSFRKYVEKGNVSNDFDFSKLAAFYNGNADGTKKNPQNYYYGTLLAKQFQRAVDDFYQAIEKEAPASPTEVPA